ncbi:MAG: Crp/Fnr family transcriptional regulator [Acidimicrobiia bacterium]|nr:Crp/Fnr family transcriptional regulator [Acidimicrobiia bacterium]
MSTPGSLVDQLAATDFFSGMAENELELLARHAQATEHDAGVLILQRGRPASGFYLITEGRVALQLQTSRGALVVQTLGRGDVLGLSWLIAPRVWQFSAKALTPISSIHFETDALLEAAEQDVAIHDDLVSRFMGLLAKRLHSTRLQLLDLYQPAVYQGTDEWIR